MNKNGDLNCTKITSTLVPFDEKEIKQKTGKILSLSLVEPMDCHSMSSVIYDPVSYN